jgi:hypothetical protein
MVEDLTTIFTRTNKERFRIYIYNILIVDYQCFFFFYYCYGRLFMYCWNYIRLNWSRINIGDCFSPWKTWKSGDGWNFCNGQACEQAIQCRSTRKLSALRSNCVTRFSSLPFCSYSLYVFFKLIIIGPVC